MCPTPPININLTFSCGCGPCDPDNPAPHSVRFIPKFGVASEQTGPVSKTPQYQHHGPRGELMAAQTLTATQDQIVSFENAVIKDKKGNVIPGAGIDGDVVFTTDNSDLIALEPQAGGKAVKVSAVGPPGTCSLFGTCDLDQSPNVAVGVGRVDYTITVGNAAIIEPILSAPTEQP